MTLVVDASFVVAALADSGAVGVWAESLVRSEKIVGPDLLPVEVASVLRRASLTGDLPDDVTALAHRDLLDMQIELLPYHLVADRAWELRANLSIYDAFYVAIAEEIDAPLATIDHRLVRAPGPQCRFVIPPAAGPGGDGG